jgi:hypothetical protein
MIPVQEGYDEYDYIYVGVASGNDYGQALRERFDDYKKYALGVTKMRAIFETTNREKALNLEKRLIQEIDDHYMKGNRSAGKEGRSSTKPLHWVYIAYTPACNRAILWCDPNSDQWDKILQIIRYREEKIDEKNKWMLIKPCCVIAKGIRKKFVVQVFEKILQINASPILSTINTDTNPLEEYYELMQD